MTNNPDSKASELLPDYDKDFMPASMDNNEIYIGPRKYIAEDTISPQQAAKVLLGTPHDDHDPLQWSEVMEALEKLAYPEALAESKDD